ncbi:hypothetical protein [Desulfovibrio litoralis]|uniref:Membrane domain of glycerophosphoryl diester phosphodiesterase n=1 Tax=Desulfovibrio litoralis DSM 11393 TaxID=1121455 RepID=A0A1M7SGD9_9BACT|nr:hypothetical protein [Desulfovibrio litoralis]SHN57539.1 hypothetical protein SAMN02745728_00917 [Desulfovibrio litoralis DSM 11393]
MTGVQTDNSRNFILSVFSHIKTVLLNKAMFFIAIILGMAIVFTAIGIMLQILTSEHSIIPFNELTRLITFSILVFIGALLPLSAIIYASFLTLIDQNTSLGEAFSHSLSHIGSLLKLAIIIGIACVIIGSILFNYREMQGFSFRPVVVIIKGILKMTSHIMNNTLIWIAIWVIPIIIIYCRWFVIFPVCILENKKTIDTFGRSRQLTKGYRLYIFAIILILFIIQTIVVMALQHIQISSNLSFLLVNILGNLGYFLILLITTCVYYELRLRKEPEELNALIKNNYYYK